MAGPLKVIMDSDEEDEYLEQQEYSEVESSVPPATENDEFDDDEEEEEEDEEEEDDSPDEEEIPSVSEEEADENDDDNYNFGDGSDMDDDLGLKDDGDESEKSKTPTVAPRKSIKITIKPPKKPASPTPNISETKSKSSVASSQRSTRKRQVSYYAEDDDEDDFEDDYESAPPRQQTQAKKQKKSTSTRKTPNRPSVPQPRYLDPELVLTDEENEYNPNANTDFSKMTERQRSRFSHEDEEDNGHFIELDDTGKKAKLKSSTSQDTGEEAALRKAENARKRQDYKNKMLEEEKRDTLNKLLKRRATKSREVINDDDKDGADSLSSVLHKKRRPTLEHAAFVRYVNNTTTLNGNSVLAFK